jgi:protein TonB
MSSGFNLAVGEGDYLPIVKVAPIYPSVALSRGIEGYVVLEFTISRSGAVKNVVVVESSNPAFEQAATEAANKFKYSPRIIDGKPVEVEGVRNRVTFDLSA